MSLILHSTSPFLIPKYRNPSNPIFCSPTSSFKVATILSSFGPLAIALSLTSPLSSLASYPFASQNFPISTTPYSQSQSLNLGLEDGNPKSSSFSFPLAIPEDFLENPVQKLRDAILRTQRNVKFEVDEETPFGRYLQVEVDGGFGRDVMEFLVKKDIVAYRSMATKVTYIYPFTTALGDSKGQEERMNKIKVELGWYSPSFESMDN
ncbi:thylakoid lumenal 17.9 kDa protein, chloroplastic isoform X2 [Dendrobium catenatum]|uniref:thylakoid lumenal 17.9 kDa protein, chloroplastic isoform X2 n=1 Tax=Dendrobium catenatum TaxID=906689 RepID=UPI0009F52B4F|nr:thylakoid lumenal 17.9 kDa protein, chloroplastic isoform X2 [Dendrobium catenatum]